MRCSASSRGRCRATARCPPTARSSGRAGTLFPQSSKKIARAINAASGRRPVVVLANLAGFDGSPESMRRLQLEYGAEIGRAVVNFDGPIVFCVVSRYHGGAFVVFSQPLNDNLESIALEGAHASVIGGAPAAAVVFARDVDTRTREDPRIAELDERIAGAEGAERERLRAEREERWTDVRSEKLGELAGEFDAIHSVERARRGRLGRPHHRGRRAAAPADRRRRARDAADARRPRGRERRALQAIACSVHLGEPERVARRVVEAGVDAVGALLGLLGELDAARLELLVVGAARRRW